MTLAARAAMIAAMAKDLSWHGRLRIEDYVAWWSGSVGDSVPHRHFAAQAIFSDTPVALLDENGARVEGRCLLIEPDARHRLLRSAAAELCYVEPTVAFGPPDGLRARIPRTRASSPVREGVASGKAGWPAPRRPKSIAGSRPC